MVEKFGVKETKEFIIGLNEVSLALVNRFKDGVQITDFLSLWDKVKDDPAFRDKLKAAYEGYKAIPVELADLDLAEGVEIVTAQAAYIPTIIEALKK